MTTKKVRKKKLQPRLPLEAVLRLRSHPVSEQKGLKTYDRKVKKKQNRTLITEELIEDNV
jgi:hypothetical protein